MSYKDFQAFTAENCLGYTKIYEISRDTDWMDPGSRSEPGAVSSVDEV